VDRRWVGKDFEIDRRLSILPNLNLQIHDPNGTMRIEIASA